MEYTSLVGLTERTANVEEENYITRTDCQTDSLDSDGNRPTDITDVPIETLSTKRSVPLICVTDNNTDGCKDTAVSEQQNTNSVVCGTESKDLDHTGVDRVSDSTQNKNEEMIETKVRNDMSETDGTRLANNTESNVDSVSLKCSTPIGNDIQSEVSCGVLNEEPSFSKRNLVDECEITTKKQKTNDSPYPEEIEDCAPTRDGFFYNNGWVSLIYPVGSLKSLFDRIAATLVKVNDDDSSTVERTLRFIRDDVACVVKKIKDGTGNSSRHVDIPNTVYRMLVSLEASRTIQESAYVVNQMVPLSCYKLGEKEFKKIQLKGMSYKSKNDSNYVEVEFYNPIKIVFCATTPKPEIGEDNGLLRLYNVFGGELSDCLRRIYERLFDMTEAKVKEIMAKYAVPEEVGPSIMCLSKSYKPETGRSKDRIDEKTLSFLRENLNSDWSLEQRLVFHLLATSGGAKNTSSTKLKTLVVDDGIPRQDDLWGTEYDGIFLSSHIRCRILLEGVFQMQIYSRRAIKIVD